MNFELLARELVRSLRGSRSQTALSRRLGYRTNILYLWESGRGGPTAVRFLRMAQGVGVEVVEVLTRFYRHEPRWLAEYDPVSARGVGALLDDLRGTTTIVELASAVGCSRFTLARWLKGAGEPQLHEFLKTIERSSHRLLDFIACFVDPAELPSARAAWLSLEGARRAAYESPWSHAVLRVLELEQYQALPTHRDGWIASRLGIRVADERSSLTLLEATRQIRFVNGKWVPAEVLTTDTRADPLAARKLKSWWSRVGTDRFEAGAPGVFSYNVFAVSDQDLERLQELQRAYFRQLRTIVANSEPAQNVAVVNMQLFSLLQQPILGDRENDGNDEDGNDEDSNAKDGIDKRKNSDRG